MYGQNRVIHYQAFNHVNLKDAKHINITNLFLHSTKMPCPKKIKNLKLIKIMKELKNPEDAIEEINKMEELETEIIIGSTKKKLSAIEKEKINRINVLEEGLKIETVKRRTKEKLASFKMKNEEIARRKITELETEIKSEIIIKAGEQKTEILREVIEKKSRELNTKRKLKKKEMKKLIVKEINQEV